jgi:hypothetical protein
MSEFDDIRRHRANKLKQWAIDSIEIYESADVEPEAAVAAVVSELMNMMVYLMGSLGPIPPEALGELVIERMREFRKYEVEREASK